MANTNNTTKYSEEFKKTIVNLHQSGKSYSDIQREYGVSSSALANWIKKYSRAKLTITPYLPLNKSKNSKNVTLNLKRKISY